MAKFELPIYGADDEIVKHYETDHIRWSVFLKAVKLQEELKDEDATNKLNAINQFMKIIFPNLTDDELENADGFDIANTFKQILAMMNGFSSSKNE